MCGSSKKHDEKSEIYMNELKLLKAWTKVILENVLLAREIDLDLVTAYNFIIMIIRVEKYSIKYMYL